MNNTETFGFSHLSKYRSELMGVAMIFIVFFHAWLSRDNMFFGLRRCGNIGVDMFLFLSGIGLWFSWNKQPNTKQFYKNRFKRIYPTWIVITTIYYLWILFRGGDKYTQDVWDLLLNVLFGYSFWTKMELTFWYVPAMMALYIITPVYLKLIRHNKTFMFVPLLCFIWSVIAQYVKPISAELGHLEIFFSRIPIFLLGINCGVWVKENKEINKSSFIFYTITAAISLFTCYYLEQFMRGRFPLFLERYVYIPLSISLLIVLSYSMNKTHKHIKTALKFLGEISLEFYLIHCYFVLVYVEKLNLGYIPTILITFAISLPIAKLVSIAINKCMKLFFRG